jgi:ribosomal protein S7
MPRRARPDRREVSHDAKYRSATVSRLIGKVMQRGQKRTAETIVYGAL